MPYLLSESQKAHLCKTCDTQLRNEIKKKVFQQPIAFQPTNTLENHCIENEIMMKENEERKRKAQKQEQEEHKYETEEEKDSKKKKKEREWDDWKEFHSKGTGNLNGL